MVYLVGAGPGDPGLITVAGRQRLKEADVIVYDRLVNEALLKEARPEAELLFVGKVAGEIPNPEGVKPRAFAKAGLGERGERVQGGEPLVVWGRGGGGGK